MTRTCARMMRGARDASDARRDRPPNHHHHRRAIATTGVLCSPALGESVTYPAVSGGGGGAENRNAPNGTAALSFVANLEAARYVFVVVVVCGVMDRGRRYGTFVLAWLAALRHVVRPPPAARAALLLLLGRIRREALPAFAPLGLLRACSCVVCCVLFALICTRPHTTRGFIRPQAKKSRKMNFPFTQGQPRRPDLSEDPVAFDPGRPPVVAAGSTRTAGRPWADPRSVVRGA